MEECLTCKKHFSQGGNCWENKNNCLLYDQETRGKIIETNIAFKMVNWVETPMIRPGEKIVIDDRGQEIEMKILKINWINLNSMMCGVSVCYHENEKPYFERRKLFTIAK